MYRLLAARHGAVRERRDQLSHPPYARPELLATRPNELWSWDISKLKGPATWTCFHRYVILDVFSRSAVGWTVVQPPAPPLRDRSDDPGRRPRRHRQRAPRSPSPRPQGRLRGHAGTVRPPAAHTTRATDRHLDQQTHDRGRSSLNSATECLIRLDRLRPRTSD